MLNYESALAYIDSFINYEKSPDFSRQARFYNLNRISHLLNLLGNPHRKLKVIHIGGSKGKGSTAAIIASILTHAGYKTGAFTSPHFVTPRERCCIDAKLISKDEFADYLNKMKPAIEAVAGMNAVGAVSFFEIYTALAFCYFADNAVDFAVIEVGLGGRLDATNVVQPFVTVITPVSLEHTAILGDTLEAIAKEKAEIIKRGCPLVLAPQEPESENVFESVAAARHAGIDRVGHDISFKRKTWNIRGQTLEVNTLTEFYPNLFLPLLGQHQAVNAATALACIERIKSEGHAIPKGCVYDGLKAVRLPGRMQLVSITQNASTDEAPLILLDGAHSPTSAAALCEAIQEVIGYERLILIAGLMKDKNIRAIGRIVCQIADIIIATQAFDNPRVMPAGEVVNAWSDFNPQIGSVNCVGEAIEFALSIATPSDLICITGSIYLVGAALSELGIGIHEVRTESV